LAEINENHFHSLINNKNCKTLAEVKSKMSEDARLYEMTYIVHERLLCIRNLNVFLAPIFSGSDSLQIPNSHPSLRGI
jgi:hypothetical protein